jgi:uncharacterized protein YccT (UPF0319 family)
MSFAATIALMTTAVVAKLRPTAETKRIEELEREIEELEVRLDSALQDAKDWRVRYERMTIPYAQAQQAAMQQYAAMQAQQNAQNAQNFYGQGLAQMQGFDGFCNCVPSRAQVWGL